MPYSNTAQSSGIIGYCAQFKTPVVVPNHGLLGKLVRRYSLGYTVDLSSSKNVADFITQNKQYKDSSYKKQSTNISENSEPKFQNAIIKKLGSQ